MTVKRAEAVDVASLPTPALQREYVFDESDNRTFFDDHVNSVTYHYKYKSIDQHVPLYSQGELRQIISTYVAQNFARVIEDIEAIIQDDIESYTGQTLQELEQLAQEDLEEFVVLLENVAGQDIEEIYGDDFQQVDLITVYSDQIGEILIHDTAAGHRTVEDFVSLETFLHDADGNMTKRTLVSTSEEVDYTWTDFDRLKRVESNQEGRKQDARYDADGLRKRKLDKNGNSSVEYGVGISTSASVPGTSASAAPSISYIYGHLILGAEIDGEFVFHLGDALGTVRDVVDDSGTVIRSFEFSEYGDLLSLWSSGTGTVTPKTWIGGFSVNDDTADSGLWNMGHRNYAGGVLGRFISRDPIGFAGNLNLYAYPTNPVTVTDASGLQPNGPHGFTQAEWALIRAGLHYLRKHDPTEGTCSYFSKGQIQGFYDERPGRQAKTAVHQPGRPVYLNRARISESNGYYNGLVEVTASLANELWHARNGAGGEWPWQNSSADFERAFMQKWLDDLTNEIYPELEKRGYFDEDGSSCNVSELPGPLRGKIRIMEALDLYFSKQQGLDLE